MNALKTVITGHLDPQTTVTTIVSRKLPECPADSVQTDLFRTENTIRETFELAFIIPSPFYWSDFRLRCAVALKDSDWGKVGRMMMKSGHFRRIGSRRSPIPSRRGGLDWLLERY